MRGPPKESASIEAPSPGSLRDPTSPRTRGEVNAPDHLFDSNPSISARNAGAMSSRASA